MSAKNTPELFWSRVEKKTSNECWNWCGYIHPYGYGYFRINGVWGRAHRLAWEFTNGKIPNNLCVLHKCDNPKCCNPKHLFLGTREDNVRDMINKKRDHHACGESQWMCKLTAQQVHEIRVLYSKGNITQQMLGKMYGVNQQHISSIINNKKWK